MSQLKLLLKLIIGFVILIKVDELDNFLHSDLGEFQLYQYHCSDFSFLYDLIVNIPPLHLQYR